MVKLSYTQVMCADIWMKLLSYNCALFPYLDDKNPCHLSEAPGPCRGLLSRYFFDSRSQQCKHFFYGGCFGNANNFKSMSECRSKCQNPGRTDAQTSFSGKKNVLHTFHTLTAKWFARGNMPLSSKKVKAQLQ